MMDIVVQKRGGVRDELGSSAVVDYALDILELCMRKK
jgi:hypothetical protein